MENIRNYQRCHVMGEGRLSFNKMTRDYRFDVVDISASGVRIVTQADIDTGTEINMGIEIGGHIMAFPLRVSGTVTKKEKIGSEFMYALRFTNLSQQDRVEIDEIVRRTCNPDADIQFGKD